MRDPEFTQKQLDAFVDYVANVKKAIDEGVVSDTAGEINSLFGRYLGIHEKVAVARDRLKELRAALESITDRALKAALEKVFILLKDAERFLDSAEEGSFRTLFFQAEDRQVRAFNEIERRVDGLYSFTCRLVAVWKGESDG